MPPNILVARLSSLGDLILTAPVYRNLKAHWPDARITLLVKPQYARALEGHPAIDEIMPFEGFFSTLARVRAGGFTHYLDLHSIPRTVALGALSGIKNRVHYKKDSLSRQLFVKFRITSPALERHTLNRYLDALKQWDVPAVFDAPELSDRRPHGANSQECPDKICIIQTAFLGDAVLTVPLVKQAAALFPGAKLAVVSRLETADIFRQLPEVAEVIEDNKKGVPFYKSFSALASRLREGGYRLAIIPHRSFRSAFCAWLAGIPERLGFDSSAGRIFLTKKVPFSWLLHDAERNLSLLNAVSKTCAEPSAPDIRADSTLAGELIARLEAQTGWQNPSLIGVHPGSVWFTKRWFPERFADAIKAINAATGAKTVLVGGKSDNGLCQSIADKCPGIAINWAGKTGIPELMALTSRLKLFITNDSGPMHIATAYNVPTVAIFGPTTKELGFFPYGKGHRVLEAPLPCRPCALHGGNRCPRGHFLCMRLITADMVSTAALEIMRK